MDAVLVCRTDGTIIEANEAASVLFRLDACRSLLGGRLTDLPISGTSEAWTEIAGWLIAAPSGSSRTCELQAAPAAGDPLWAEIRLRRVSLAGGDAALVVIRDITDQKAAQDALLETTRYDLLTGLPNRRAFREVLDHEMARYERYGGYLCVAIGSVVDFRAVDRAHGAAAGDAAIAKIAASLRQRLRKSDYMARWGRDEFAFLIHDTRPDTAMRMLNRMEAAVEHQPILEIGSPVRLRFGVTGYRLSDKQDDVLDRIERARAAAAQDQRKSVVVG
jgi:diguanylate cyclase (GGDEF)-like protein